ncbi:MAG TPA: PilW family protein [Gammaproteobacteria bacterium]
MKPHAQTGVTLIELMTAMLIGLILIGGTASVYIANKEIYRTSETAARMQENGRIALHVIVNDLRMAGFMGNSSNPSLVDNRQGVVGQLPALSGSSGTEDCTVGWYIDMTSLLVVGNNQPPVVNGTDFSTTCLDEKRYQSTTDVVALKRAAVGTIDDLNLGNPAHANRTLIRSDLMRGAFFIGGTPMPAGLDATTAGNRRWLAHVYFIAPDKDSNIPELRRITLGSGPNLNNRELVPGVQDLQIHYGIDTDDNGTPDSFVEPGTEGAARVVAARVWLLVRSETPEPGHDDSRNVYEYASKRYIPGDATTDNGTEVEDNPEQYRRLLVSATVTLRN